MIKRYVSWQRETLTLFVGSFSAGNKSWGRSLRTCTGQQEAVKAKAAKILGMFIVG